jgi:hypothetical protein
MDHLLELPPPQPVEAYPLYINRPLFTDADIDRAEVQEQAA